MNKRLDEALTQVRALPEEQQQAAAELLFEYLDAQKADAWLSPEQIAEIERRVAEDGPYATEDEVRETFARLTK
jgi:hypothetical protein